MVECTIVQKKMRPFSKLIGCFSRIADEVAIEANSEGLILRAVSLAQSGYMGVHLMSRYFDEYSVQKRIQRCKLALKPCHAILKSVANVERCTLRIDESESRVIFEFQCRLGVKKMFKLTYDDTAEPLQAIFSKETCPNYLLLKTRLLSDATQNIASSIEEISLLATNNRVKLRTHVGPEAVLSKVLLSEVILVDKDFETFRIVDGSQELIFPLKELKAVIKLADTLGLSIGIHFNPAAGTPIIFSLDAQQQLHLSVDVVLATQVDSTMQMSPAGTPNRGPTSSSPAHSVPSSQQQAGRSAGLSGMSPIQTIPGISSKRPAAPSDSEGGGRSDVAMASGGESDGSPAKRIRSPVPTAPAPTTPNLHAYSHSHTHAASVPTPKNAAVPVVATSTSAPPTGSTVAAAQPVRRVLFIPNVDDDEDDAQMKD